MRRPMQSVSDIFEDLGGPAAVSRMLDVNPSTASEMKRRGSIPPEYWPRLVSEAGRAGLESITYENLALAHAAAKGRLPIGGASEAAA